MVLDPGAQTLGDAPDGALQRRVIEGDQTPTAVAQEMIVVLAAGQHPLEAGEASAHGHSLDQTVLDQQLEHFYFDFIAGLDGYWASTFCQHWYHRIPLFVAIDGLTTLALVTIVG